MSLPNNPHAIVEIVKPGATDGQGTIVYDSWENPRLFESVSVELPTNETAEGRITFFDPNYILIDSYSGSDAIPQATVRIFLGYGQDLGEPIFKGLLAQVQRRDSSTVFVAFDMGFKMKLEKKAAYKNKKDDLQILKDVTTRNGLKFEGPEKPLNLEPNKAMIQDEKTDWEFALERAHDSGLLIFVRQDTLFAKYPAKTGTPTLTLKNKVDFVIQHNWEFIYRTPENKDAKSKIVKVRGRGRGGKRIEGKEGKEAKGVRGRGRLVIKRSIKVTKNKLTARARAQRELEREHAFEGHVEIVFPPTGERLDVRNTVALEGVGKLFSGNYLCDRATYDFEVGKLSVSLDLYRDTIDG